jgi:hypothetical protein
MVPNVKSLQAVVGQDWLAPIPVMELGGDDVLHVGFDEMSHNYHRFVAHLDHCEYDWTPSDGLFESDWLEGFNDLLIDDYENSLNTTVSFTHYRMQIPNSQCSLKMSGNYRLTIRDEDEDGREVAVVEFRVVEPLMSTRLGVTANTDIDHNNSHQQVSLRIDYGQLRVTNHREQVRTIVMQNGREDNMKEDIEPNYVTQWGLEWKHSRSMIFEAGNEYHKFEVLDPTHTTMGLDQVAWDEEQGRYHTYPYVCEPQRNYLYTEDANGTFYIRNSDNVENDRTCDYVYVHYQLKPARHYKDSRMIIAGKWTTELPDTYVMEYDEREHAYHASVLQKMGYYNYQLLLLDADGVTHLVPEEGSFYQTENDYQALVYYKGTSDRTWRLVGYSTTRTSDP